MADHSLPVDVLRLVLQAVLGEGQQDAFTLVRHLQNFSLVCKTWREAAHTTPLAINTDYLPELPWQAFRWLLRHTIADLQVHPSVAINKVLTNPDWAARHRWVLRRLWGAQLVGAPGRWPQFRHFPQLHTLELHCDNQAVADSLQREGADLQHFESRVLQPLGQLKHLALRQFGSADLTRLPASLECLDADLYTALPLALPPGLQLQELTLTSSRLLVDWALLCTQVSKLLTLETPCLDMLADASGANLYRQAAQGFIQGTVLEVNLVAQEVCLVQLEGSSERGLQALPKRIPPDDYRPEVLEAMHLVTLAADFQQHQYRTFGCVYNPDDIQADEELGMLDGMAVQLCRYVPDEPQVLGFSYGLQPEQLSYLLSEAMVGGLALEAIEEEGEVARVLNDEDFQRRCAGSLAWLQGPDLDSILELGAYTQLKRLDAFVLPQASSLEAVSQLPPSLTSLDLCAVCAVEAEPSDRDSWPEYLSYPTHDEGPDIMHLTQLKELSLRHFREIDLREGVPPSVETISLECPQPRMQLLPGGEASCEVFDFCLPRLEEGALRTLDIQLHASKDYGITRPRLWLHQLLGFATRLIITVSADPVVEQEPDPDDLIALAALAAEGPRPHITRLELASNHASLREAVEALTASSLQSIEVEADEVAFVDASGACAGSRAVQQYIQQQYGATWLIWAHDAEDPEEAEAEAAAAAAAGVRLSGGGGFTMRRK